jgi:catechol 2,3-dioxygenase-like lactoylglutathione lyase family enzyme
LLVITKLSHATVYVVDQDRAKDFYCNKLGFEVRTDATMGDFRWLTVGPKTQPELEVVLMKIAPSKMGPGLTEEMAASLRKLVEAGVLGAGVWNTDDCMRTYAELKERGVVFASEPKEMPYGVEAVFRDDSGNFFSLTQRKM